MKSISAAEMAIVRRFLQPPAGSFSLFGPPQRTARIGKKDLAGLQAFGADYPEAERWLLSFSPEPLGIDGIRCEPLEPWLRQLQIEPPG